jgi:hypothetical protein
MISKKFLILVSLSTLFVTTALGAEKDNCLGGVCIVNLDNLKPSKGFGQKEQELMVLEEPRYIDENYKNDYIDKSMTIVLDGETITVFPKSTYVMNEEEKNNYIANEEANKDLLMLTQTVEKIEDKILEKSYLPSSEFYCEKNKKALYNQRSDTFLCV